MDRTQLLEVLQGAFEADRRVRGVWLTGSMARQEHDAFSDADLLLVVREAVRESFVRGWNDFIGRVTELVFTQATKAPTGDLFTHITSEWVRFDVTILQTDELATRSPQSVRVLLDRDDLTSVVGSRHMPYEVGPEDLQALVCEFIRVLGLLPVVVGRSDYIAAASGACLLRSMHLRLLGLRLSPEERGGALKISTSLSSHRQALVEGLPAIEATKRSTIEFHQTCARAFLEEARKLAGECGAVWPSDFEVAARSHWHRELGISF